MSFIASKKWSYKLTELTKELRSELFVKSYDEIDFLSHRNSIHPRDNYHPKTWVLNIINTVVVNVWDPYLRTNRIKKAAEDYTYKLIQIEDENTDYSNLAPVNAPMQMLARYIVDGPDSYAVKRHIERLEDFKWVKGEGMLVNGTNGVQNWDTAFTIQAAVKTGLAQDERFRPMLVKALEYLTDMQVLEDQQNIPDVGTNWKNGYRHPTKGSWGFSNKDQGYSVCDCTSEALKAVVMLQAIPSYPKLMSEERLHMAVDNILTYQNPSTGGCSSYELRRGSELLEWLNAAEVFGRIMVEYDYPECTTACVIALTTFRKHHPDYRTADIKKFIDGCVAWIRKAQRADGSWYGAWGVCFTYAGMFGLESLASVGETYESSERVRRGCKFFIDHQMEDGGWGETYKSCVTGVWSQHENSQVVQTAWVIIALLHAEYPDIEPIKKAVKLLMGRQQSNGEWLQEGIEGVFNKSCMISYPNYKFEFPIQALGMFVKRYGDIKIQ
jgi:lanosterol synthase